MDDLGLIKLMRSLFGDPIGPGALQALLRALQNPGVPQHYQQDLPGEDAPGLYWDARHPDQGGTQRLETATGAPSADHYRLVDSMEEAESVFARGERPLLYEGGLHNLDPDAIEPGVFRALQEDQWAAPNGTPLFTDQGINPDYRRSTFDQIIGQQDLRPSGQMSQQQARDQGFQRSLQDPL